MIYETKIMGHLMVFKTWTWGLKQQALREATKWRRGNGGELEPDVDPWRLNDLMLLYTLQEWDLTDEKGEPLPLSMESIHGIEPPELVEAMIAYTQRINGLSGEERKKS
jgi:hypothetical protein